MFQSEEHEEVFRQHCHGKVIGAPAKQELPDITVDMIGCQCHIRLHEMLKGCPFWDNVPQEPVVVFAFCFLVGTVGFTEKDAGALSAVNGAFHSFNVRKFMTIIGKDEREAGSEQFPAKGFLKDVQQADHGSGGMCVKDK